MTTELALYEGPKFEILKRDLSQVKKIFETNVSMDGIDEFDLDRVSIPGSGAAHWSVPDLNGEPEAVKELEGVVILHGDRRAFWDISYEDSGGGSPPDCNSLDGRSGFGWRRGMTEGQQCAQACKPCPLSQWGSNSDDKEDNQQACSNRKLLFFLRQGDLIPLCIDLAPTSVKPFNRFMLRLAGRMLPAYGVVLGLKLIQEDSRTGVKYSIVSPRLVGPLSDDDAAGMEAMGEAMRPLFLKTGIETPSEEGFTSSRGGGSDNGAAAEDPVEAEAETAEATYVPEA